MLDDFASSYVKAKAKPNPVDAERASIERGASELGIDPVDYATAISYETGGTFSPTQPGPRTKWGQHRGTIQYGEPQWKQYGVTDDFHDQVARANVKYLKDAGVRPGATFDEIYAAINGGSANKNLNTPDANTGRTIADNIRNAQRDHRAKVLQRYGWNDGPQFDSFADAFVKSAPPATEAPTGDFADTFVDQQKRGITPTIPTQQTIKNPAPVPEAPETIEAQITATRDANSTKAATLLTDANQETSIDRNSLSNLERVETPNGILYVNPAKAKALGVTDYVRDMPKLIGKVAPVADTSQGMALRSEDANGTELSTSIVPTPQDAQAQAAADQSQFPGKVANQQVMDAPEAAGLRIQTLGGYTEDAVPDQSAISHEEDDGYHDYLAYAASQKIKPLSRPEYQQKIATPGFETSVEGARIQTPGQPQQTRQNGPFQAQTAVGEIVPNTIAGRPNDNLDAWLEPYFSKTAKTAEQASVEALVALGRTYGITRPEAEAYVKERGPARNWTPGTKVDLTYRNFSDIKGEDVIRAAISNEQSMARPTMEAKPGVVGVRSVDDLVASAREMLGNKGAEALGGIIGSGGRNVRTIAGAVRPFSEDAFTALKDVADFSDRAEASMEQPDGWGVFKLIGGLPGDLSRLYVFTRMPSAGPIPGPVIGFATEAGLQSSGRGDKLTEIARQTAKGGAIGTVFSVAAPMMGRLAQWSPLVKNSKVGQAIFREGATVGTIFTGTAGVEKAFGSTDEQAIHAGMMNSLLHLTTLGVSLIGKVVRGRDAKGNEVTVGVDQKGDVKLLRGEVKQPDIEMFFNEQTKQWETKTANETTAPKAEPAEATVAPDNQGGYAREVKGLLGEDAPQRIETADPAAVQKAGIDTRIGKVVDVLKTQKDFIDLDALAKQTRLNKTNLEDAVMTLYGARMVELLPGNRVRLISEPQKTDLFEKAKTYGQTPTVSPQPAPIQEKPTVSPAKTETPSKAPVTGTSPESPLSQQGTTGTEPTVKTESAAAPDFGEQYKGKTVTHPISKEPLTFTGEVTENGTLIAKNNFGRDRRISRRDAEKWLAEQGTEPTAEAIAKEPWQMTKGEWDSAITPKEVGNGVTKYFVGESYDPNKQTLYANREQAVKDHKYEVEEAIRKGKAVPPEVLAEYPDLQLQPEPAPDASEKPRPTKTVERKHKDLSQYVRAAGGMSADSYAARRGKRQGELDRLSNKETGSAGFVNKNGKSVEDMAVSAWQSGYLRDVFEDIADVNPERFLEELENDFSGVRKHYTGEYYSDLQETLDDQYSEYETKQAKEAADKEAYIKEQDEAITRQIALLNDPDAKEILAKIAKEGEYETDELGIAKNESTRDFKRVLAKYDLDDEFGSNARAVIDAYNAQEAPAESEPRAVEDTPESKPRTDDARAEVGRKVEKGFVPKRFEIDKPIVGPTGAKIIAYEWKSKLEEYVDGRGEERVRRVSDWDDADTSEGTGRSIVHHFYVEHPDGKITLEGINSAQNILGIAESRLKTIAKNEQTAQKYREDQKDRFIQRIEGDAPTEQHLAAREFRMRYKGAAETESNEIFDRSRLLEKDGKFYRVDPEKTAMPTLADMQERGWSLVPEKDDSAKRRLDEIPEAPTRKADDLSRAEKSAIKRDLAPKEHQGAGKLRSDVARAFGLKESELEKLAPLGPVGKFGQTSHAIKRALSSTENDEAYNALANIFLTPMEVRQIEDPEFEELIDRGGQAAAIMDAIAEDMGYSRSSEMDANAWGAFIDKHGTRLDDDAIDVILSALEHQQAWHQNIIKFTEDKELDIPNRRIYDIGTQFGWDQFTNPRWGKETLEAFDETKPSFDVGKDSVIKKEYLRIGDKYGIKTTTQDGKSVLKQIILRAIQRTATEELEKGTDTRPSETEGRQDTPTSEKTRVDEGSGRAEELAPVAYPKPGSRSKADGGRFKPKDIVRFREGSGTHGDTVFEVERIHFDEDFGWKYDLVSYPDTRTYAKDHNLELVRSAARKPEESNLLDRIKKAGREGLPLSAFTPDELSEILPLYKTVLQNTGNRVVYSPEQAKENNRLALGSEPKQTEQKPKPEPVKGVASLADFDAIAQRIQDGEATADDVREAFQSFLSNEEMIKAELGKKTIAEIKKQFTSYHAKTKAEWVKSAYDSMRSFFTLGKSVVYSPFGGGLENSEGGAIGKIVREMTDADVTDYVEGVKSRRAERKERLEGIRKALEDPETLAEFETYIKHKLVKDLSPEKRKLLDRLQAEKTLETRKESKAKSEIVEQVDIGDAEMTITKSYHTKHEKDVWIVSASEKLPREQFDELNNKAKQLGGRYRPAWKPTNTPAGFQFFSEDSAIKFVGLQEGDVDRTAELERRAAFRQMSTLERLRDSAKSLREAGEESLSRDRLANTARRAAMAANAERVAKSDIAFADTMDRVTEAIEKGEVKYLTEIWAKTHFETLERLLRRGVTETEMQESNKTREEGGAYYQPKFSRTPTTDDIDNVKYPFPVTHEHDKVTLEKVGQTVDGVKMLARGLAKNHKFGSRTMSPKNIERLKELVKRLKYSKSTDGKMLWYRFNDAVTDLNRLDAIGLVNSATLREALREYLPLRKPVEEESEIKKLERELVGTNYGRESDYFPTPPDLARRVAEAADIRSGMTVLEPSAGKGNLLDAISEAQPEAEIEAVEMLDKLRKIVELKGYNLVGHDFMDFEPGKQYDRIVMNPPFKDEQEHIRKAFDLLQPGGRLVAITSPSWTYNKSKKAEEFRQWVDDNGGYDEDLPEGSFARGEVSTGVNTKLLVIDKAEGPLFSKTGGAKFPDLPLFAARQVAKTETPEFKKWFGDSKVVDENGKPLVVYHGTSADFEAFDTSATSQFGAHFTPNPDMAGDFTGAEGGRTIPVYLSLQNPYDMVSDLGDWTDMGMLREYLGEATEGEFTDEETDKWQTPEDVREALLAKGYDGLKYQNSFEGDTSTGMGSEGQDVYIAFEPTQIKSAISNSTFDPENPSILFTQTDLFGNEFIVPEAKAKQLTLFDAVPEVKLATPTSEGTSKNRFDFDIDNKTWEFLYDIRESENRKLSKPAEAILSLANDAKSDATKQIVEDAADALDIYARILDKGIHVDNMLKQLSVENTIQLSPRAEEFARSFVKGTFPKTLMDAINAQSSQGPLFMTAWHGSPHKFQPEEGAPLGRFRSEKIGTGEGNQVYGWGLYFTDQEQIAEHYKKANAHKAAGQFTYKGENIETIDPAKVPLLPLRVWLEEYQKNTHRGNLADVNERAMKRVAKTYPYAVSDADLLRQIMNGRRLLEEQRTGAKYRVDLKPGQDEYLLWDKPLSEQSEKVKKALKTAFAEVGAKLPDSFSGQLAYGAVGDGLAEQRLGSRESAIFARHTTGEKVTRDKAASEYLKSLGIRGNKYLDGSSRYKPIKDIKRAFMKELPEDADFDDVLASDKFDPQQKAFLKALAADDWLGFDYPAQAISAALGPDRANFDISPELKKATEALSDEATHNYVIFDDADVEIKEVHFSRKEEEKLRRHILRSTGGKTQPQLFKDAEMKRNPDTGLVEMNEDALTVLTAAFRGSGALGEHSGILGAALDPENTERFTRFLDSAADAAKNLPEAKAVQRFVDTFKDSIDPTYGDIALAYSNPKFPKATLYTSQEELGHLADIRSMVNHDYPFRGNEAYEHAKEYLIKEENYSEAMAHREITGKLQRDDAAKALDLTEDEVNELRDIRDLQLRHAKVPAQEYLDLYGNISDANKRRAVEYATRLTNEPRNAEYESEAGSNNDPLFVGRREVRRQGGIARSQDFKQEQPGPDLDRLRQASLRSADRTGIEQINERSNNLQNEGARRSGDTGSTDLLSPKERAFIAKQTKGDTALQTALENEVLFSRLAPDKWTVGGTLVDLGNAPKAIKSSLDASAAGRQGIIVGLTNPRAAARAFWKQLKAFRPGKGADFYDQFKRDLDLHPYIELAEESGLYLGSLASESVSHREEAFMSRLMGEDKVFENKTGEAIRKGLTAGTRLSERGYLTYLDSLRMDAFRRFADEIHQYNKRKGQPDNIEQYKGIATWINYATGRGDLGQFNSAVPILNATFWSARYWASRLQVLNPNFYRKLPPGARKVALREMAKFAAAVGAMMVLLKLAGFEVEYDDPNDPDSLKVGFGKYKYDLTGGLIQHLRYAARMAMATQDKQPADKMAYLTGRYLRSKLAPTTGGALNAAYGENYIGEPTSLKEEGLSLLTPLSVDNFTDSAKAEGLPGIAKMAPEFFGISVTRYKDAQEIQGHIKQEQAKLEQAKTPSDRAEAVRRVKAWQKLLNKSRKYDAEDRRNPQ